MGTSDLFVGCCGWAEAQGRYIRHFPTIEIQTTFYQPPAGKVAIRWRSLAPAGFRFCMKAWQLITHTPASPTYRRLKVALSPKERDLYGSFQATEQVTLAWERTREIATLLDAQVILFQCPKSFLPTRQHIANIRTFFAAIDRGGRALAWEPRGDDWSPELVRELCAENDLIHCVDPFQSSSASGDSLYWRLHGKTGYSYRYTDQDLAQLAAKLAASHVPGPSYVLFNNIYSNLDAARFLAILNNPDRIS